MTPLTESGQGPSRVGKEMAGIIKAPQEAVDRVGQDWV